MNLFYIPSWYPSTSYPTVGCFFKEKAGLIARERPNWNVTVSLWGSHEPSLWIRPGKPLEGLFKISSRLPFKRRDELIQFNLVELFTPARTWTRRVFEGNIQGIIDANIENFSRSLKVFGKVDLIQAEVAYPAGYIAKALSRKFNIPYVVTEHVSPFPLPGLRYGLKKYVINSLKEANQVISVSDTIRLEMARYKVESIVMPNMVDIAAFDNISEKVNGGKIRLLSIGRLVEQKGFDMLLAALQGVSFDFSIRIVGSGPLEYRLKKQANRLFGSEKIEWLGELTKEQVAFELNECDAFILSSRHESFGVVLIEAMSCGKPVVYTKCGGITSELPGQVGVGSEVSSTSLRLSIEKCVANISNYNAQSIREYVVEKYAPDVVVNQLEQVYQSVLKG